MLRVRAETTKNRLERMVPYSAQTGVLLADYQVGLFLAGALGGGPDDPAGHLPWLRCDRRDGGRLDRAVAPGLE